MSTPAMKNIRGPWILCDKLLEPNISHLTVHPSEYLALSPFITTLAEYVPKLISLYNSDWGISRIKGPLCSQETFVSSDRFHQASMVTDNWAWKEEFIKWTDLEKETEMEENVGIVASSQTELLSLVDIILLSALLSSLGVYWVFYWQNIFDLD